MKYIITILLFFSFVACEGRQNVICLADEPDWSLDSTTEDVRCTKIMYKAYHKGTETGVCYRGPLLKGWDEGAIDPDPEACDAIIEEAIKKCDALPPPGPDDIQYSSGSGTYQKGKLIMKDGKPVCD